MIFYDQAIFEDFVTAITWGIIAGVLLTPFLLLMSGKKKRQGVSSNDLK
jgi:hypothetical protein